MVGIKYVDLKVGYDCNNSCIHCVISDQRDRARELRGNENRGTQEFFDELLKSKENGCTAVTITGGDPTVRKDFHEIVKFSKEEGFRVLLQSNGRAFSSKKYLEKAFDYIDYYMIALHGSSAEIHDKITRAPNGFVQTIDGIKNILEVGGEIGIKVVISNINKDDLLNLLKFVDSLGVKYCNIAFPHANGDALKYFDEIVPYYKNIDLEIQSCIKFAKESGLKLEFEQILPCSLSLDYDLKFFSDMKIHTNFGEIKQLDETPGDWNSLRAGSKRKGKICMSCVYNKFCEGYWKEYVELRGFSEFRAIRKFDDEFKRIFLAKLKSWKD
ncbi:MAG: radical SAM protein [Candidatus Woesearchaeota archaeon]|jgi:MoaA/NifB/PqqE/SkfB family radical SAM enzyme|nr:radical SAM protein [Candidatus Woesearchaeota archaeon]